MFAKNKKFSGHNGFMGFCWLAGAVMGRAALADEALYYNCVPLGELSAKSSTLLPPPSATPATLFSGKIATWPPASPTGQAALPQSGDIGPATPLPDTVLGQLLPPPRQPTGNREIYWVEKGDTLYAVMRKTGVPAKDIIGRNQLSPPYNLRAGQSLQLSSEVGAAYTKDSAAEVQTDHYLVRVGDTLYSIARQTGISAKRIISLNQLGTPYNLNAGQQIRLR